MVSERFIRTLKKLLYKIMTEKGTKEYMLYLNGVVFDYNNTVHGTIKMKPADVKDGDLDWVYANVGKPKKKPKFKTGDVVRISKDKRLFEKGYTPNWSEDLYEIQSRVDTNPWTYKIQDKDGNVYEPYYEQELQKSKAKI